MGLSDHGRGLLLCITCAVACNGATSRDDPEGPTAAQDGGPVAHPPGQPDPGGGGGGGADGGNGGSVDGGGGAAIATEPELKIALFGDTSVATDFRSVLRLAKDEGAQALIVLGDLTYGLDTVAEWFARIDAELPDTPYFVARGNHDLDWASIGSGVKTRLAERGVAAEHNDPTLRNYSVVFKGLKVVLVDGDETTPSRLDYVGQRFEGDRHLWRICAWHKNQRDSNAAQKLDEMGWAIYESCRSVGAIVAQGHSHTYSRSKTLTSTATQTVDPTCPDPFSVCVGPGKHFFLDSSLGGMDMRPLSPTVSARPYWASTFTGSFGVLFLTFHVDGDPRKARGYFKTVGGTTIDPPASSGKTSFDITSAN